MRSTATWRSTDGGGPASERKSGWCQATSAPQSTCTTKSGTAAAAEWKEAGRSLHVGRYARNVKGEQEETGRPCQARALRRRPPRATQRSEERRVGKECKAG